MVRRRLDDATQYCRLVRPTASRSDPARPRAERRCPRPGRGGRTGILTQLATQRQQSIELAGLLDALGDRRHAERSADRDDRARERPLLFALGRADEVARS